MVDCCSTRSAPVHRVAKTSYSGRWHEQVLSNRLAPDSPYDPGCGSASSSRPADTCPPEAPGHSAYGGKRAEQSAFPVLATLRGLLGLETRYGGVEVAPFLCVRLESS